MLRIIAAVLFGILVFWVWFFVGSEDHCPRCGSNLRDETTGHLRDRCYCGWARR
ncbi:MAG TPA: hypothetical protein VM513_26335 [Kofleriaceae bacterium]|nr:hypothetical protein [Kofleriaceae bacterium]